MWKKWYLCLFFRIFRVVFLQLLKKIVVLLIFADKILRLCHKTDANIF